MRVRNNWYPLVQPEETRAGKVETISDVAPNF